MDDADLDLVQRARAGDRGSFHVLVDRHAPGLYRLAYMLTGQTSDAQDVVQETLLAAYVALQDFQGRSTVRTWLTGILIRQAAQSRRQANRHKAQSLEQLQESVPGQAQPSVADPMPALGDHLDLRACLEKLTPEQRQILVLRETQGLSYDQIAQCLELPRGTVESRLHRARLALRACFLEARESASKKSSPSRGEI